MARLEKDVCVDLPAVGLCGGEACDPVRWLVGKRVENRGRAEEWETEGLGPGRRSASSDAVILPRHGRHA